MLIDHQTSQLTKKSSFLIRLNCFSVIRLSIYRIPRNGLHSEAGLNVNELMRFTCDLPLIDPYEMARRGVSERVLQIPQDSDLGAIKNARYLPRQQSVGCISKCTIDEPRIPHCCGPIEVRFGN